MTPGAPFQPYRLVVFDVDGTLYDQKQLRRHMLRLLLEEVVRKRRLTEVRVLREYRRRREALAEAQSENFEPRLLAETAVLTGVPEATVRAIVADWIDARPLPMLKRCMVPGTENFFASLRDSGALIGVLSDYPADAKLTAMGLAADHVVAATDADVAVQKPNPRGLMQLLEAARCPPEHGLMIGDRVDRDGAVAAELNMPFLLRGRPGISGQASVADFTDPRLAAIRAMTH